MRRRCSTSSHAAQPSASRTSSAPSLCVSRPDGLRALPQAHRLEQSDPVVAAFFADGAGQQHQLRLQRVVHVRRHIQQRYTQQPQPDGGAERIAVLQQQRQHQQRRHQQLHQRAAGHHHPFAERTEQHMAGFVKHQQRAMDEGAADLAAAMIQRDQPQPPQHEAAKQRRTQPPMHRVHPLWQMQQQRGQTLAVIGPVGNRRGGALRPLLHLGQDHAAGRAGGRQALVLRQRLVAAFRATRIGALHCHAKDQPCAGLLAAAIERTSCPPMASPPSAWLCACARWW